MTEKGPKTSIKLLGHSYKTTGLFISNEQLLATASALTQTKPRELLITCTKW